MATIRLRKYELRKYGLPPVCLRCGAPTGEPRHRTFSWSPPWVAILIICGLLPYLIVALILTKKMRMPVPLCRKHRWHWTGRHLIILGSLLALIPLVILAVVFTNPAEQGAVAVIGFAGGLLLWIILTVILLLTIIRPTEITDESITLAGLSEKFVDAVEEEREERAERRRRRERDEEDEDRPRRRRERDDEYYDPERRGRREPRSDAYREKEEAE
jgi:hypothetical protein